MFPPLGIDSSFLPYVRHPTKYKKVLVYAKIDGENWYDISDYVKEVTITNKLEFLSAPQIDTASITLANLHNEWTPTQYNDTFDPANGKFNGTVDEGYLQKEWEVKIYLVISKALDGLPLPQGAIEYWRYSLLGELNNTVPEGYSSSSEDYDSIAIPLFYGVKTSLKEQHLTAQMKLSDYLYYATKKKLEHDIFYINMKPNDILADLLQRAGYMQFDFQDIQYTCSFLAKKDQTIWQAVVNLMKGIAGKISTKPDGTIIFRSRIDAASYEDPSPAFSLAQDTFKKYDLSTEKKYNKVVLESDGYSVDEDQSAVVDFELQGDERIIEAGKTGTFELEYVSDYAIDVSNTILISYEGVGDTVVTVTDKAFTVSQDDPQPADDYIQITKYERYADKVVLEIKNITESADIAITHVKINGRQIKKKSINKVVRENTTGEPDKEYSAKTFFAAQAVLETIADVLYDDINKTVRFGLSMNEFYPDVYAGNLIEFSVPLKGISSGTFLVLKVEHQLKPTLFQTSLDIVEWSGLQYAIGDKTYESRTRAVNPVQNTIEQQISEVQGQIQELQDQTNEIDDRTSYIDGNAPSTPTNLFLATAVNDEGESIVRASWDEAPEADVIGYEVAWSLDGVHRRNTTTADTVTEFVVPGNTKIYVKVRALDAEGKKSEWSAVAEITSAKDEVPPAKPVLLAIEPLYAACIVKLQQQQEFDFSHFLIEDGTDTWTTPNTSIRVEMEPGSTKTIQIKSVDFSGNESEPLEVEVNSKTISESEKTISDIQDDISEINDDIDLISNSMGLTLPQGAIAYWGGSLVDIVNKITPEGYDIDIRDYEDLNLTTTTVIQRVDEHDGQITTLISKTGINNLGETETLYSKIDQNAEQITTLTVKTGVNDLGEGETLYSKITQNASQISSVVTKLNSDPDSEDQFSAIKQNAQEISSTVGKVDSIDEDLDDLDSAKTRWSTFQQLADEINLRVVAKDENGQIKATELSIQDGKIVVDADQFQIYGDAVIDGTLKGQKIEAGSITFDKLAFRGTFSLPEGAIAYWTNSLVDEINQIMPEGYTEVNLSPTITLVPENAPEGSIVGELLAADKIYGNHIAAETITADKLNVTELSSISANIGTVTAGKIQGSSGKTVFDLNADQLTVGDAVKIGKGVLPDGGDGIYVKRGLIETSALVLTKATIVSIDNKKLVYSKTYYDDTNQANTWILLDTYNFTANQLFYLNTVNGTQAFRKNIPILLVITMHTPLANGWKTKNKICILANEQERCWENSSFEYDNSIEVHANLYDAPWNINANNVDVQIKCYYIADNTYPLNGAEIKIWLPEENFIVQVVE